TSWDDHLHRWTRETLAQMREEYERRLFYLGEAIADLEDRRRRSRIAMPAVRRLAERLALDVQLQNDFLQEFEDELAAGGDAKAVVRDVTAYAKSMLDIPSHEIVAAMRRAYGIPGPKRAPAADAK